jgi:hypothetical protein
MPEPSRRHPLRALTEEPFWVLVQEDGRYFGGLRHGGVLWTEDDRDALGFLEEVEARDGLRMLAALGYRARLRRYPLGDVEQAT